MRKLTYKVTEDTDTSQRIFFLEFITDRTSKWTQEQYLRHRNNTKMELIGDEESEEENATSREIKLG